MKTLHLCSYHDPGKNHWRALP